METKTCSFCGADMDAQARVCPRCHARDVDNDQLFNDIFRQMLEEEASRSKSAPIEQMPAEPVPADKTQATAKHAPPAHAARPDEFEDFDPDLLTDTHRRGHGGAILGAAAAAVIIALIAVLIITFTHRSGKADTAAGDNGDSIHLINSDGEEIANPTAPPQPEAEEGASTETDTAAAELIEVDDVVYVTGSGVNLREAPTTTSSVITTLSNGTELQRSGISGDWSLVTYDTYTGYISNALISTDSENSIPADELTEVVAAGGDTVTINSKANARTGPGTNYSVAAVIEAGTTLPRNGVSGNWSCVTYQEQELYINNNLLTINTADDDADSSDTLTITAAADVNVRSGPGTAYAILGSLSAGDSVTAIGRSANWYQIAWEDSIGYVAVSMMAD